MKRLSIYYNVLRYSFRNKYTRSHAKYRTYPYSKDNTNHLLDFLASSPSRDAVAFVGLKQVRHSMGVDDPYSYLKDVLVNTFDTLIVPTFTPSVIETGVFDVRNTPSENGIFSQKFMIEADGRTLCPFKSYAIHGGKKDIIMDLDTTNDYSAHGMFKFINSQDIVSINIGTIDVRPSTIHYCEYSAHLHYLLPKFIDVKVIDGYGRQSYGSYFYLDNKVRLKFNRDKLEKDMLKAGILRRLLINDLVVRIIPEQEAFHYMLERLKKNPYYLVD